jgi:hypothetical protein
MLYSSSPKVLQVVRAAWLFVAVVCLAYAQYILRSPAADAQTAADSVLFLIMLILTFPAGIIAIGFAFVYSSLVLPDRCETPLDLVVLWSAFATVGYLQWFKFSPYLLEKWRKRKSQSI